ncbi:MAG: diguanylate cyclase [Candidatus Schekmanbacteria bacterium]|nr:diguanylate cyclase [Candidatus Schekmanbacteria bacterium]
MKLSTKLALFFSAILFSIITVTGYFFYNKSIEILELRIKNQLENLASNSMGKIDNNFSECFADIKILASEPLLVSGKATPEQITERLIQYKNDYTFYSSLSFFGMDRVRIADSDGQNIGEKHALIGYWKDIEKKEDVAFSLHVAESLKKPTFHFAAVVKDKNGVPLGVVVSRMPSEKIGEITKEVSSHVIKEDYKITLVNKDGVVVYSNFDPKSILKEKFEDWDFIKKEIDDGKLIYSGQHHTEKDEEDEIYAFTHKHNAINPLVSDYTLVIEIPAKLAFNSSIELRNKMLFALAGVIFISIMVIIFFSRTITSPLEKLNTAAQTVAGGNLDIALDIRSRDEIGTLAVSFSRMVEKLKESQDWDLRQNKELEDKIAARTAELENINTKMNEELSSREIVEKTLRESEDRFKTFMNNSPALAWIKSKEFSYLYVNAPMEKAFNRSLADWIGKTDFDFWPEEQAKELRDNDAEVLEKWEAIDAIEEVSTPEGMVCQWQVLKFPLKDASGEIYVGGMAVDMTKRIEAEKLLGRSNKQMALIFESMPVVVYALKAKEDFGITYMSSNVISITGYRPEQFMADPEFWVQCVHPDDVNRTIRGFTDLMEKGYEDLEYRMRIYNGKYRWFLDSLRLINPEDGSEPYILGVGIDITERKKNEEALKQATTELEKKVMERTAALNNAYVKLKDSTDRLAEQNREIGILSQMTDLLQSASTLEEAFVIISQSLDELFTENSGALYIFNASRNILKAEATWGEEMPDDLFVVPDDCWALRRGRTHKCIGGGALSLRCKHMGNKERSYICIPLIAHGETLGILQLIINGKDDGKGEGKDSEYANEAYIEEKDQLLLNGSERISMALANLKLRETLRNLAIRDPLTGLFNRRYMEESFSREIFRTERKGSMLGIIMLDIDNFKFFNDTYGHDAGDMMLRKMGEFLKKNIRGSDIACRYGGEEFLIILPEASLEITRERAEFLRIAVKELQIQCSENITAFITLSLGVAIYPVHGSTSEIVLQSADKALYKAKTEGRDRVCLAEIS